MNLLTVNFDIRRLGDPLLRMFVNEAFVGDRLRSPLVRSIQTALIDEEIRRLRLRADGRDPMEFEPAELTLPLIGFQDICEAVVALTEDCAELEHRAVHFESSDPGRAHQFRLGAEFLYRVGVALKSQADALRDAASGSVN
jgi:hypothetical protein